MSDGPGRASARALSRTRRILATLLVIALALGMAGAIRWIWRDITYWSRSVTFVHGTEPLESCAARALAALPGVAMRTAGAEILLDVPGQEGALVQPALEPYRARIVVYGHSASVSTLGPPNEEPVAGLLQSMKSAFTATCGSP
jgi:hypothetical protein